MQIPLEGSTLIKIRPMTDSEMKAESWYNRPLVLVFDSGVKIYASRDAEGNDGGSLFGTYKGKSFAV